MEERDRNRHKGNGFKSKIVECKYISNVLVLVMTVKFKSKIVECKAAC